MDSVVVSRCGFWMVEDSMLSGKVILFFYLEPTIRKDTWMRTTSVTVMVVFSKVPLFFQLLDYSYVQSSFSVIKRHVDCNVLKSILQLNILRTWINIRANSFNRKSTKVPRKLSVAQKSEPALWIILHQNRWQFAYFSTLLFPQTNLILKLNLALIGILHNFCHNSFILLLFDYHLMFYRSWSSSSVSTLFQKNQ